MVSHPSLEVGLHGFCQARDPRFDRLFKILTRRFLHLDRSFPFSRTIGGYQPKPGKLSYVVSFTASCGFRYFTPVVFDRVREQ